MYKSKQIVKKLVIFFIYIYTHTHAYRLTKPGVRIDETSSRRDHIHVCFPLQKKMLKGIPSQSGAWKRARKCYMQCSSGKELQRNASTKTPLLPRTIWTPTKNSALGQFLNWRSKLLSLFKCVSREEVTASVTRSFSHLTVILPSAFRSFFIASFSFPCPINAHALL